MTEEELRAVDVATKLTGGVSVKDYNLRRCPWCLSEDVRIKETDSEWFSWNDITRYGSCNSCWKDWTITYKVASYEEL